MSPATNPVQDLIAEVRSAFETETTIGRLLGRTKESLERFLANPASLDQVKESLASVLAERRSPTGNRWIRTVMAPGGCTRIQPISSASAPRTSARRPAASRMTMANWDGQSTAYCWVRQSSKSTSALMMAANRGEPSCVRYRQSGNEPER